MSAQVPAESDKEIVVPDNQTAFDNNSQRKIVRRRKKLKKEDSEKELNLLDSIRKELKSKVVISVILLIVGSFTALLTGLWDSLNEKIDYRIKSAIESDINQKESSKILKNILQKINGDITNSKSETYLTLNSVFTTLISEKIHSNVGALATGELEFDKSHPANVIYAFLPPESSVTLVLKVPELRDGEKIVILSSVGKKRKITQPGIWDVDVIDLINNPTESQTNIKKSLFEGKDDDDGASARRVEGLFNHVHSLRVQMALNTETSEENRATFERKVYVQYFLATTPLINLGKMK